MKSSDVGYFSLPCKDISQYVDPARHRLDIACNCKKVGSRAVQLLNLQLTFS